MMVTLRLWPTREPLRVRNGRLVRGTPRAHGDETRLPRFRLALVWRRTRRERATPVQGRGKSMMQADHRLHVILRWSAEIRRRLERVVEVVVRTEPAARIFLPYRRVITSRAPARRLPLVADSAGRRRLVARVAHPAHGHRVYSPVQKPTPQPGTPMTARWFRVLRVAARVMIPQRRVALRWPSHSEAARARTDFGAAPGISLFVAPPPFALRRAPTTPIPFAPQLADAPSLRRPVRRAFRHPEEIARPIVPPQQIDLVWRKRPARIHAGSGTAAPLHSSPVLAAGLGRTASATVAAAPAIAGPVRAPAARAMLIDSATMNRLTNEVIGRIEQKMRTERERRGL